MAPSVTRIVGSLVPGRCYHWLVVQVARLPLTPARVLPHSVVFRHPLHPRTKHYVLVPSEYSPTILDLPAPAPQRLQEDIREWVSATGWRFALIVVNFGSYQETPFLHIHLLRSSTPPADGAESTPDWLAVELEAAGRPLESGRRVVRYDALQDTAEVITEVNRG